MRCNEVVRELAAPTGDPDASGLAEHLTRCPRCASWAEAAVRLDRLWEATRPPEPSSGHWERTWAGVSHTLDHASVPEPSPLRLASPRPWRRSTLVAFGLAQAAAILLAVGLLSRHEEPTVQAELAEVEIAAGRPVLIRYDLPEVTVVELPADENPGGVDSNYDMLNDIEALDFGDAMAFSEPQAVAQ